MDKEPSETKEAKTKTEAPAIAYRYVGSGEHFVGIPMRDLTKDEYDALTDEQKSDVTKSGYYKKGGK